MIVWRRSGFRHTAAGFRYFGAHAQCCRQAVRPDLAELIDLADVPPGLDHFLVLPA